MKLTKQQLKQLIKEELQNALQEAGHPRRKEALRRRLRQHMRPQGGTEPAHLQGLQGRSAGGAGEAIRELTLDDIFAELQEIKGLISREMTPAGLGIGAPPE
jgi:hypothetical protein